MAFSPLFYGIRDVTKGGDVGGLQKELPFSPLFYGIRDVTAAWGITSSSTSTRFQSPILRDS